MTDEDALRDGIAFAEDYLKVKEATHGGRVAVACAGAIACGARNYIAERQGTKAAWELLTGLAGDLLTVELNKKIEAGNGH